MDRELDVQTEAALDVGAVLSALSEGARTERGRRLAKVVRPSDDLAWIRRAHDQVDEVRALERDGGFVPVGGIADIADLVSRAGKGAVLDKAELRGCGVTLALIDDLGGWIQAAGGEAPVLAALAPQLRLDTLVVEMLRDAFDAAGELSESTYPFLADLRQRVAGLHQAIRRTLDDIVKRDTMGDILQDRFVTQRGDRYVVPVKINFKRRELGIVHGVSSTGQTAFIEPHAVVELNNDLKIAEGELDAEERRILAELSHALGRMAEPTLDALDAATEIDLACARATLADRLDAHRPTVRTDGVLRMVAARHPVLALRGLEVVPNDLSLDARTPILIVSGPNTGGKTVALKTVGLAAWLVRLGCFVPAAEGSRVDVFPDIVALIGDHQSVLGDHSSFSAHLAALDAMLRRSAPGALFLIDEIASGTDPHQGAALAIAVVERWLEVGVRAVLTTHFQRLKTLGATDARIATAGMEFAGGRPTYRLVPGASGESHALDVALRIGIDPTIVHRAEALLEQGERNLADALAALDRERGTAAEAAREAARIRAELSEQQERLTRREQELDARARRIEQDRAAGFLERLAEAEKTVAAVVADLQRAPSHDKANATRAVVEALKGLGPAPEPEPPRQVWSVGDRARFRRGGDVGEVLEVGRQITVRTQRGLTVRAAPAELERLGARFEAPLPKPPAPKAPKVSAPSLEQALRTDSNTLDLRGMRVDDGIEEIERFLARAISSDHNVVFFLHGHGTGAMKQAVRRWLPTCREVGAWRVASAEQGGDAYTVAALRL